MIVTSEPRGQLYVVRCGQPSGAKSLQWCSVQYGEQSQIHPVLFDLIPGKGLEASNAALAGYVDMKPVGSAVLLPMGITVVAPIDIGNGAVKVYDGPIFLGSIAYGLSYTAQFHEDHSSQFAKFEYLPAAIYWLRRRQQQAVADRRKRSLAMLR